MGFLSMIGAVPAEEYAALDTKYKAAIKDLAAEVEARDNAIRNYSEMSGIVSQRDAEIVALRAEVADLRPDAQATRQRRWNDRNRERPSRAKKVEAPAPAKPAPKAKAAAKKAVRK